MADFTIPLLMGVGIGMLTIDPVAGTLSDGDQESILDVLADYLVE